jgi:hypothetical protein
MVWLALQLGHDGSSGLSELRIADDMRAHYETETRACH